MVSSDKRLGGAPLRRLPRFSNERDVYLDSKFIAVASALEAISRVGHDLNDLPQEKFDEYMTAVRSGVSDKSACKWACRKLKYVNFTPAGKLVRETLEEIEPFASFVVPDVARFEENHRNARNAYVHQNEDVSNGAALTGEDLHAHTEAALFLVWCMLLVMLGTSPQELVDALQSSSYRWANLYRAQSLYAMATARDDNGQATDGEEV